VANARVRLYNENSSTNGGDFYNVNDNSWQEESVTWDSAPAADTTLLASRVRAQMAKRGKQVHLA